MVLLAEFPFAYWSFAQAEARLRQSRPMNATFDCWLDRSDTSVHVSFAAQMRCSTRFTCLSACLQLADVQLNSTVHGTTPADWLTGSIVILVVATCLCAMMWSLCDCTGLCRRRLEKPVVREAVRSRKVLILLLILCAGMQLMRCNQRSPHCC
jgi:hypothetical protein